MRGAENPLPGTKRIMFGAARRGFAHSKKDKVRQLGGKEQQGGSILVSQLAVRPTTALRESRIRAFWIPLSRQPHRAHQRSPLGAS